MRTELGRRTVLRVSERDDGDIEIALVVESPFSSSPEEKQALTVRARDVPLLIEMLRQHLQGDDPEDRSTLRHLRPIS
jgi:hypothetical protein